MSAVLSKKQEKAAAFRAKQKAKKRGVEAPEDLPEADLVADDDATIAEASTTAKKDDKEAAGKKRKRGDDDETKDKDEKKDSKAAKGKGKDKKEGEEGKGKGKDKKEGEEGEDEDEEKKKTKKDIKQRFILFIGNLGFKTTRDEVAKHFAEAAGRTPSVRLLTEKAQPGAKAPPKSRGIAFLELANGTEMQACMKLHHTILNQRRINVELTAGGGGKSAVRKGKIAERNTRVGTQRERRAEKEMEEAIKNGTAPPVVGVLPVTGEGNQGWKDESGDAPDGFKMRNGRRVKIKGGDDRAAKRSRTDGGDAGWGGRGGGGRKKWEPTGANAVAVGN